MFNMDEFLKDLDDQNSALEAMLSGLEDVDTDSEFYNAMEGFFKKPKTVEKMLASLTKTINKKCKTPEDCDTMLENIASEEAAFNGALTAMKEAAQAFKDGTITKKEMKDKIKPEAKKLKKTCNILKLSDINDKTDNVTDEELQNLKDFLVGAKDAINAKKDELSDTATESLLPDTADNVTPATEGVVEMAAFIGGYVIAMTATIVIGANLNKNAKVCRVAIKDVKNKIKPQMKQLKDSLKIAKKSKNWAQCISILKEMQKCNNQMKKIVDKLVKEKETGEVTTDKNGENARIKKIKTFNAAVASAAATWENENDYIENQIVLYTEKMKASSGPATEAAYMAGFNAAIEALMAEEELDIDDVAVESDTDIPDLFDDDEE